MPCWKVEFPLDLLEFPVNLLEFPLRTSFAIGSLHSALGAEPRSDSVTPLFAPLFFGQGRHSSLVLPIRSTRREIFLLHLIWTLERLSRL